MVKRTGPTTLALKNLIQDLRDLSKKNNVKIWWRVAKDLEKSTRQRRAVNLYKLEKYVKDDETAVVPGKVLNLGSFSKKTTVAAYQFSEKAREKINKTGKAITIKELIKQNPNGKKVRIMG